MSTPFTAIGLFCEDIRAETGGTDSLIGIYPDNVEVPSVPGQFSKLSVYIRVNFAARDTMRSISTRMVLADGHEVNFGEVDQATIEQAYDEAARDENPIVGIVNRATMVPLPIRQAGRIRVFVKAGDHEILCASLNVKVRAPSESSEASSS